MTKLPNFVLNRVGWLGIVSETVMLLSLNGCDDMVSCSWKIRGKCAIDLTKCSECYLCEEV